MLSEKLDEMVLNYIKQSAKNQWTKIVYDAQADGIDLDLGEPIVNKESISFDLNNLDDHKKKLLKDIYYPNALKR